MKKTNIIDKIKLKKMEMMLYYGLTHKQAFMYPDELFERLRPFNVGGFPASILLFENELCNGHCYDRAMLMQLPFKDARVVHADIEHLRITCGEKYAEHAFVETEEFGGGKTWVIDTSMGLIYDKDLYYRIEKPKVNRVFTKEECMKHPEIVENLAGDFEKDKWALTLTLPLIENAIKNSNHIGTILYREKVLKELEVFKEAIDLKGMQAEMDRHMELLKKGPEGKKQVDLELGIVRDEYGREMSRNGVPNPYYVSREQIEADNREWESVKGTPKEKEYLEGIVKKCVDDELKEYEENSSVAEERLAEIMANPTINFYELGKGDKEKEESTTEDEKTM